MTLFRPVGLKELELIAESGWRAFPPRLEWQPIFYPVLNFAYAEQIARDWNTTDDNSGHSGFVTRFEVDDDLASRYDVQIVGSAKVHQELWVPAEDLAEFNRHLLAPIEVVASYYGDRFDGVRNLETDLPTSLSSPPPNARL
ncbi:MAG: ADP-ribosylation/crystallin J1 [Bacteroidota bacterium]